MFRSVVYSLIIIDVGFIFWLISGSMLNAVLSQVHTDPWRAIRTYRGLLVLNSMFNSTFSSLFYPLLKTDVEIVGPASLFMAIRLGRSVLTNPQLLILPALGVGCFLFALSSAAVLSETHEQSIKFLRSFHCMDGAGIIPKLLQAQKSSCMVLKAKVGALYFVDRPFMLTETKVMIDALMFLLINF